MGVTSGLYSEIPGSPVDGDIYLLRESYWDYLVYSAADAEWKHVYGGFACRKPDYGDFTWVNQGGASVNTSGGGIFLLAPASATANLRMLAQDVPTPPYTVDALVLPNALGIGLGGCGIGWYESSSEKIEGLSLVDFSAGAHFAVFRNATPTTDGTLIANTVPYPQLLGDLILLRLEHDGVNLYHRWSNNLKDFNTLYSHAVGDYFSGSPNKVCFISSARSASFDVGGTLIHWDPVGAVSAMAPRHISDYLSPANLSAVRAIY